ncbi:MFS transporter [Bacillus licheniformis]|nr:MFS transporter [Bacillus licheniformis]
MAASKFNKVHLTVSCGVFAIAFDGYDIAMYGVSLPWLMEEWSLTAIQAGAIGSYTLIGMMLGALIFRRSQINTAAKGVGLLYLSVQPVYCSSRSDRFSALFTIMRFLAALGMGGLMPNAISLMTEYSPKNNRAVIVAAMYCGYSAGGVLASLVGMFAVPVTSWRVLYLIGAVPLFVLPFFSAGFPNLCHLRLKKRRKRWLRFQSGASGGTLQGRRQLSNLGDCERKERLSGKNCLDKTCSQHIRILAFRFQLPSHGLRLKYMASEMMQASGYGLSSSLSFNLALCCGQAAGAVFGGYLADKAGHKMCLRLCMSSEPLFAAFGMTMNPVLLYLLIALGGACTVGAQNIANPYISEYYPKEIRATGIGWALGVGRLGAIIAPSLFALILASGMEPKQAFMVFAIPSVLLHSASCSSKRNTLHLICL